MTLIQQKKFCGEEKIIEKANFEKENITLIVLLLRDVGLSVVLNVKRFLFPVPDRSKEMFLSIIKEWVVLRTIFISDIWKAYNCSQDEGFQHLSANHSFNFVDPSTGAQTKTSSESEEMLKLVISNAEEERLFLVTLQVRIF